MTTQQAFDLLQVFGDKAVAGGHFKTVGDAIVYRQVCETLMADINEKHQMILDLNQKLEPKLQKHA